MIDSGDHFEAIQAVYLTKQLNQPIQGDQARILFVSLFLLLKFWDIYFFWTVKILDVLSIREL
jgi:hypothetical protein